MTTVNYTPNGIEPQIRSSFISLLLANLLTAVLALYQGWDLRELMIIYWSQSIIIGYFSFRRMRDLKQFSTEGVSSNGKALQPTPETQRNMSKFFILHYGGFHFVYLIFLFAERKEPIGDDVVLIALCVAGFLVNHWYSYVEHRAADASRKPNIGTIMFFPYARILPMHLTIIAGGAFAGDSVLLLLLFLGLKTLADVIMHAVEHLAWGRKSRSLSAPNTEPPASNPLQ